MNHGESAKEARPGRKEAKGTGRGWTVDNNILFHFPGFLSIFVVALFHIQPYPTQTPPYDIEEG